MKKYLFSVLCLLSACAPQVVVGPSGPQGPSGVAGPQGTQGSNGLSIVATTLAATATQCPSGGSVVLLAQDTDNNGVWNISDTPQTSLVVCNGQNAVPVTPVQLCSGVTTYPNSFPEFGFCINNTLFGTYWDGHNAWTAEIAPGHWSSTSSSVSCNFTVTSGCNVSH